MEQTIDINQLQQDDHNFNKGTEEGGKLMEKSFRELGAGRSILVDKNGRIIAGNKSQVAAKKAGIKKVRIIETNGDELIAVKRTDIDLDTEKGRRMALADNRTAQVNLSWDETQLHTCADQIAGFDTSMLIGTKTELEADIGKETIKAKRKAWHKGKEYYEPLCDLKDHQTMHVKDGALVLASYQSGKEGKPLSKIKVTDNAFLFALQAERLIRGIVRMNTPDSWCIITTPKRRHKTQNFAETVCIELSKLLHVPFHRDVVLAKNRQRVNPEFLLAREVEEPNVIIYDDIFTTGSTMEATANLFPNHNIIEIIGIWNH